MAALGGLAIPKPKESNVNIATRFGAVPISSPSLDAAVLIAGPLDSGFVQAFVC